MIWDEAVAIVKDWDRRHEKDGLCADDQFGQRMLHSTGKHAAKQIQKYSVEQVKKAIAEAELDPKGWPKFGKVLAFLLGQSVTSTEGALKWQHGDVLEAEGRVNGVPTKCIGIISRRDADNYVALHIPLKQNERTYWFDGTSHAGEAMKLPDDEARAWVDEWRDDSYDLPMGFEVWKTRAAEPEPLDTSVIPF